MDKICARKKKKILVSLATLMPKLNGLQVKAMKSLSSISSRLLY